MKSDWEPTWKQKDGKWEYSNKCDYAYATIEEINGEIEIQFQFVLTIVGGEVKDGKCRSERMLDALRNAIPEPEPW